MGAQPAVEGRLGRTAVMGYAAGVEELSGFEAIVGHRQIARQRLVWTAEHSLQLRDQTGIAARGLLVGGGDQPLTPGDPGVNPLHRSGRQHDVAIGRDLLPPALQPMRPLPIKLPISGLVKALMQG